MEWNLIMKFNNGIIFLKLENNLNFFIKRINLINNV